MICRKVDCYHIRNMKGQICTTRTRKGTLSHFDDKRFHVDACHTRAYYHPDNGLTVREEDMTSEQDEMEVEEAAAVEEEEEEEEEDVEEQGEGVRNEQVSTPEVGEREEGGVADGLWRDRMRLATTLFR